MKAIAIISVAALAWLPLSAFGESSSNCCKENAPCCEKASPECCKVANSNAKKSTKTSKSGLKTTKQVTKKQTDQSSSKPK